MHQIDACEALDKLGPPNPSDPESDHAAAEQILCDFLRGIGYGNVASAFENARERVGFWYA
jgi:hypothetical protein